MTYANKDHIFLIWDMFFVVCFVLEQVFAHQTVAQIALLSFCAFSFLMIFATNFKALKITYLAFFYALFVLLCYLGLKYGNPKDAYVSRSMFSTLLIDLAYLVFVYIYIRDRGFGIFKKIFLFSAALCAVIILIYYFFLNGSFNLRDINEGEHQNGASILMAIALLLLITDIKSYGWRALPYILIYVFFIIMSGTKKAILAIAIGLVLIIYLKYPQKLFRNIIISLIAFTALYFIVMKIPFIYNILGSRLEILFDYLGGGNGDASTLTRANLIEIGLRYYKNNPVWGIGVNAFRTIKTAYENYAHNNYVELLCDTGLTGTISYYSMHLTLLLGAMITYFKGERKYAVYALIIIVNVIVLDFAMVSYYERTNLLFLALCAGLIAEGWLKKKNEKN